ncbi:orexin receptor type 2-like [Parasteatoda tepidariorum]|uniref:orexin receptor type 2-like n=1 Tax=Parasteatoda tepidariorum TaxID=114398 RepID=UPI00077FA0B9|nr:orexin receptor type 2-like [Parasteatoda tepidariorum]
MNLIPTEDMGENWTYSNSSSGRCTNEYCVSDEDYLSMIEDYIFPSSTYEWILIFLHITVFLVGLIGNALVSVSVYRNHSMRTVTNYFIVNLAVADFLVILICLPPTVLWDVTKTWFFGSITCKLVLYLQNVSVGVSVLTLTFISVDRWYAICHPLSFKSTPSRAKSSIFLIWSIAILIALPEAIVLDTRKKTLPVDIVYLTDCTHTWSENSVRIYQLFLILVLYVAPFSLMAYTYYQITRVLWNKNIPGSARTCGNSTFVGRSAVRSTTCESQIRSRRKASKMLIAVVVMFSLCYFPVHLINLLRYTVGLPQTPATTVVSLLSHWLCYANSAINPIIYNIMNGKFRQEFKNTFTCQCWKKNSRASYFCKYTSTVSHSDKRIHELANFS